MPALSGARAAVLVSLLSIAAAACQPKDQPAAPPRAARVVEAEPKQYALVVDGSGTIEARNTSDVGFLVAGRLQSRNVNLGDTVKVGDLLARLDPTDMQNKLDAAKASVVAAQASVAQAAPTEAGQKKLLKDGFTTQQSYDQALQALQTAQANLASAEANQRLAEDQLKYTTLNAPVPGVITKTGADAGQVVNAGQMVVEIAQSGDMDAVFSVSARIATGAKIGAPVEVSLQEDPTVKTVGALREIAPNADPVTGTYTVRVGLTDPPARMRLGALVTGHAEVPGDTLVKLPATAILLTGKSPEVWVVVDGKVQSKPVTVSRYDTDAVFVASGLDKGDLVVVAGVNSLAAGQAVSMEKVAAE